MWAPCGAFGHRRCLAACGAGLEVELAGLGCGHWSWHRIGWLWACTHPRGARLGAANHGWGMSQAIGWPLQEGTGTGTGCWHVGGLSAHPAHVCHSCAWPPLPGPQMVARKRRPVPPPSVHHHASLAPWLRSPAGAQGWEQLGHPEPGWGAPRTRPPVGHSTPPRSHPTLARGQAGRLRGARVAGGSWHSPPASQMVPRGAVTLRGLPWRPRDVTSGMTSE